MKFIRSTFLLLVAGITLAACEPQEPAATQTYRIESGVIDGLYYEFFRYNEPFDYKGFVATHKMVSTVTNIFAFQGLDPEVTQEKMRNEAESIVNTRACPTGTSPGGGTEYTEKRSDLSITYVYRCI